MPQEPHFWEVMDSFVLLVYAASTALLQSLLACLNFAFDLEDCFCWYKRKKWFLWTIAPAQTAENHGDDVRFDLILTMRDIYINSNLNPVTRFTSNSRSTKFKDILSWNISQMITKTIPISTRIVISYAMKWSIPLWIKWKVNENWDNNMTRISQWRESHQKKKINPKEQDCESQSQGCK